MSALSISSVVTSGNSAQAPVSPDAPAADNSPFAMLLAAITAADPSLQTAVEPATGQTLSAVAPLPQAANDDGDTSDIADTASDPTATIPQLPTASESAPSKNLGKPDKKADTATVTATVDPSLLQTQMLATQPVPIPPAPQAAVQTQAGASDDEEQPLPALSGITASTPAIAPAASAPGPASAQPPAAANDVEESATATTPAAPQIVADDGDSDDGDTASDVAAANQTLMAHLHAGAKFTPARNIDSKPATNQAAAPQASQATALADDDADVPPASNPGPAASVTSLPNVQTPPQTDPAITASVLTAAPQAPQKPATGSASKPTQTAIAGPTLPNAITSTNPNSPTQAPTQDPSATADNGDSKPTHVSASAPQPDAPQALPQGTSDVTPQVTAITIAGPNAQAGVTLPVHVANHDSGDQTNTPAAMPNTDALAVSIAARSVSGAKQFDIRLDPPELGRVEVRLSIDASGKTQAHLTADQPQTVALLQKDAPNLTRALRDAGLDVSQSGLNFSLKGQGHNQGGQNGNFGTPSRSLTLPATAQSIDAASSGGALPSSLLGSARLDIHV